MRVLLLGFPFVVACGPASSGPGSGGGTGHPTPADRTFEAECEVQCRTEADNDGCAPVAACVEGCVAMSGGLETLCGKCVVARTDIYMDADTCELDLGTVSDCEEECEPGAHKLRPSFYAECQAQCGLEAAESGCAPGSCVDDCVAMTLGLETQCGKCIVAFTDIYTEGDAESCVRDIGTLTASGCDQVCVIGSHQVRPDFRAECEVQCRREAEGEGCSLPPHCVDDCVAMTLGLETQCGKCVVAQTDIYSESEESRCQVDIGNVAYGSCDDECSPGTHQPRPDFRAECGARCRIEAESSGCPQPPSCVDDCVAMTAGLETQCGKCVVAQTDIYNEGDACELDVGTVDSGACDDYCAR